MAAAPIDPWNTGLMALGGIASGAVNDKTNMTNQAAINTTVDNSGWAVNIGSGTQTASSEKATAPIAAIAATANSLLQNPLVLLLIAVGLYAVLKK